LAMIAMLALWHQEVLSGGMGVIEQLVKQIFFRSHESRKAVGFPEQGDGQVGRMRLDAVLEGDESIFELHP